MSRKKWEIDRRTFLRGSGAAIALPALNAMAPSIARAQTRKKQNLFFIWHPNGIPMASKPDGTPYKNWQESGSADINSKLEAKLAPVKKYTNILCGLQNSYGGASARKMIKDFDGKNHAHGAQMISAHCGKAISKDSDMARTFDQHIAHLAGNSGSLYKSLAININPRSGQTPLSQNLINTIAWRGPNDPLKHHSNPREFFDLIFKGGTNTPSQTGLDAATKKALLGKRTALDNIVNEIKSIRNKVGKEDRFTLEKYFTEVEELDRKTASILNEDVPTNNSGSCNQPQRPESLTRYGLNAAGFKKKSELFYDMVVKAFQCDLTRVTSMMLGNNAGFGQGFNLPGMIKGPIVGRGVGIADSWHNHQHWYQGSTAGYYSDRTIAHKNFVVLNEFIYQGVTDLALKMKNTPTVNGKNLLDESLIVFGSTLATDQGHHDPSNWSRVLIGGGNGTFKTGQKIKYKVAPFYTIGHNESIFSVWLTIMRGFGVNMNKFGDSSKILNEILA